MPDCSNALSSVPGLVRVVFAWLTPRCVHDTQSVAVCGSVPRALYQLRTLHMTLLMTARAKVVPRTLRVQLALPSELSRYSGLHCRFVRARRMWLSLYFCCLSQSLFPS